MKMPPVRIRGTFFPTVLWAVSLFLVPSFAVLETTLSFHQGQKLNVKRGFVSPATARQLYRDLMQVAPMDDDVFKFKGDAGKKAESLEVVPKSQIISNVIEGDSNHTKESIVYLIEKLEGETLTETKLLIDQVVPNTVLEEDGTIHLYISSPDSSALGNHTDTTDVFVLHLDGAKEWMFCHENKWFGAGTFGNKLNKCTTYDNDEIGTMNCETIMLEPGDALFLPRRVVHSARATHDEPSAHLTFGFARTQCLEDEKPRRPEPALRRMPNADSPCNSAEGGTECTASCDASCLSSCDANCFPCTEAVGGSSCDSQCGRCDQLCDAGCPTICNIFEGGSSCDANCDSSCDASCDTGCDESCDSCDFFGTSCDGSCDSSCDSGCNDHCDAGCRESCDSGCPTICDAGQGGSDCDFSCDDCFDGCDSGCALPCLAIDGGTECNEDCSASCDHDCNGCPPPTPAPTISAPPTAGGGAETACFSGESTVDVQDKGTFKTKELGIGDTVLAAGGNHKHYSIVYSSAHYEPNVSADFLQIWAESTNKPLDTISLDKAQQLDQKAGFLVVFGLWAFLAWKMLTMSKMTQKRLG